MRYYSPTTKQRVKEGPRTLGLQLARLAIKHNISIFEIAQRIGTARQTVYNWYSGHAVSNAYKQRVQELVSELKAQRSTS